MTRILYGPPVTAGPEMEIRMQSTSFTRRMFAALLIVGASHAPSAPAKAAEPPLPCAAASSPRPVIKKGPGLGGLFGAVKRAGVGNLLGSGILGEGETARAAESARSAAAAAAGLARSVETICKARDVAQRGPASNGKSLP